MSEWRNDLKSDRQCIERIANTKDGEQMLGMLERIFQVQVFDADPIKMAYNVGQYELVEYLKRLRVSDE